MRLGPYLALLKPQELALRRQRCPLCAFPLLLRLSRQEHGVRCPGCRAGPAHMALAACIRRECPDIHMRWVYEMSARGPLQRMLHRESRRLQVSEYFDDVAPGQQRHGVRCEDVQRLSFADGSFDLCTSTEVFEHVVDDLAGFREIARVLKPGGRTLFTVPLNLRGPTVERASLQDGRLVHHLPPEYHDDHLRGRGRVLASRSYGIDITERLRAAGFREALIDRRHCEDYFGFGRPVVIGRK